MLLSSCQHFSHTYNLLEAFDIVSSNSAYYFFAAIRGDSTPSQLVLIAYTFHFVKIKNRAVLLLQTALNSKI